MALYTATPKQKTNSQLICTNLNYRYCGHIIEVCYQSGEEKEGQFPLGFGKRGGTKDTVVGTRQELSHQIPTTNVAKTEEEDKQTFAFMTIGDSNIKVQSPLSPEIAMSFDSHKSYSCNKTTNQDQRLKGVRVGNDQTSRDLVIFHTKTESRLTLIDSGTNNHYFIDKSMFSSYTPLVNLSEELSAGKGLVFSIIGKENVKFQTYINERVRNIILENVLQTSELRSNLILVSKLEMKDTAVIFKDRKAIVELANSSRVLSAIKSGKMYIVKIVQSSPEAFIAQSN